MNVPVRFLKTVGPRQKKQTFECYCSRGDCFAAKASVKHEEQYRCACLQDNDFGGKPCPFFKTKEMARNGITAAEQRRIELAKERKRREAEADIRTISGVMFRRKENKNGKV